MLNSGYLQAMERLGRIIKAWGFAKLIEPNGISSSQYNIMRSFYGHPLTDVVVKKNERQAIWRDFNAHGQLPHAGMADICPALVCEINKAIHSGSRLQSAVFSECAYAQTYANMFQMLTFTDLDVEPFQFPSRVREILIELGIRPRYAYQDHDGTQLLVQAGGAAGVDAVLFDVVNRSHFSIEFKEPAAKTSEPDLPLYGEDGYLRVNSDFLTSYPQFEDMLNEQLKKQLNFFARSGSNVKDFSASSIEAAVRQNYLKSKFADVICTEDTNGLLTMIPADHAGGWATTRGEIRPAGRNKRAVWTPKNLAEIIRSKGGCQQNGVVSMPRDSLETASARGGDGRVNRYKISSLFFVYARDVRINGDEIQFDLQNVHQLKPTISAHMFFDALDASKVRDYYFLEL